ncbi:OmpA family protein [Amylibacter sp. SFDW26]|uniref:OmpA family protein n=1 Tax=Amylibacter sp. SFDW26 TaxID=2652722 RepID=UPI001262A6EB|nr:OmpA family protein [Amylibacter sp. SFDW26]KAB7613473.1 OmpA family protein [Amylibacter sp. SFDW26]
MMKHSKLILSTCCVIALSACKNKDANWFSNNEVGPQVFGAPFGTANANNIAVHTGNLTSDMLADLTRKFASEAPATLNFEFNSSRLDQQAKEILKRQAAWIKKHQLITFKVYGHTDKVGSPGYNKNLGKRRAQAAVNYLISLGVSRHKIRGVASFGETQPLVLTEDRNRENRRTVTEVAGFGSFKKGGGLSGQYALQIYNRYITLENLEIIRDQGDGIIAAQNKSQN